MQAQTNPNPAQPGQAAQLPNAGPVALERGIPYTETLPNGLDIILLPQEGADKAGFSLIFRGGTDVQTTKTAGLFKLLEHLIFRGVAASPGEPEPAGVLEALSAQDLQGGVQQDRFFFLLQPAPSRQLKRSTPCSISFQVCAWKAPLLTRKPLPTQRT